MALVAVRRTSSLGQSRKERLALVPAGTRIFSLITEFILISQNGSDDIFSRSRDIPSCWVRSTVLTTNKDGKGRSLDFVFFMHNDQKVRF